MSKQINDGGPAFSRPAFYTNEANGWDDRGSSGMTLRGYIAASALSGLALRVAQYNAADRPTIADDVAGAAVAIADAVIAELGTRRQVHEAPTPSGGSHLDPPPAGDGEDINPLDGDFDSFEPDHRGGGALNPAILAGHNQEGDSDRGS